MQSSAGIAAPNLEPPPRRAQAGIPQQTSTPHAYTLLIATMHQELFQEMLICSTESAYVGVDSKVSQAKVMQAAHNHKADLLLDLLTAYL